MYGNVRLHDKARYCAKRPALMFFQVPTIVQILSRSLLRIKMLLRKNDLDCHVIKMYSKEHSTKDLKRRLTKHHPLRGHLDAYHEAKLQVITIEKHKSWWNDVAKQFWRQYKTSYSAYFSSIINKQPGMVHNSNPRYLSRSKAPWSSLICVCLACSC